MTRARGELQLLILGALTAGPIDSAGVADRIDEPDGRRKVEVTLRRLADRGLVHRVGEGWGLTMAGRGYISELQKVLGGSTR